MRHFNTGELLMAVVRRTRRQDRIGEVEWHATLTVRALKSIILLLLLLLLMRLTVVKYVLPVLVCCRWVTKTLVVVLTTCTSLLVRFVDLVDLSGGQSFIQVFAFQGVCRVLLILLLLVYRGGIDMRLGLAYLSYII